MRLWTVHPKYMDSRGLVALWREALLAQAVLQGRTFGYLHHPQLIRFRQSTSPAGSIASYLQGVYSESMLRGYRFDRSKIASTHSAEVMVTTLGQLDYEWAHLKEKLRLRAPSWLAGIESISRPDPHPLFRLVPGPAAEWEVTHQLRVES
ncbi:MAG: DNA lyase [Geobacteraceae bacterium GWC2_58_44]|nr:MAG: DNA lyase [Geobacteraceae bacterium GWC2_58_44]HBG07602.1 DNA lyase [Geobacter sp.]